MSYIRMSGAALLLMMSGSALAEGPARLALPLPTVPALALSQVLGGLPAVNQLLGGLGVTTGGGATALLPGLVPTIGTVVGDALGSGAGAVLGSFDPSTGDVLPGLLPALGDALSLAANPGGR
jgi:hypothetical protein